MQQAEGSCKKYVRSCQSVVLNPPLVLHLTHHESQSSWRHTRLRSTHMTCLDPQKLSDLLSYCCHPHSLHFRRKHVRRTLSCLGESWQWLFRLPHLPHGSVLAAFRSVDQRAWAHTNTDRLAQAGAQREKAEQEQSPLL